MDGSSQRSAAFARAAAGRPATAGLRETLLERAADLARLTQRFDAVCHTKRGACVLVHGKAGIGKTSLLNVFLAGIAPEQARRIVAGCEALFTARPLGPLVDLAHVFPPSVAGALHEGRLWNGLFPSLLAWLRETALPTVLAFEDLHWADAGTLDFVRYAGRRLRDVPVLLLLTYRSDELPTDHALRQVLGELPADITTRIAVAPLSEHAVGTLAERAQRPACGVFEATGGNPFYVTEVLANDSGGVPPSVRDAVLGRLATLPADARALAEAVSVFPNQVTRHVVERLQPDSARGIDACLQLGLLVSRGSALAFRHELAREAVLASLLPHRRTALHAAAFAALHADDHGDAALVRLVHFAEGAGLYDEVARLAPRAAQVAAQDGVPREAVHLYGLALAHGTALPASRRAELLEALADVCRLVCRYDEAIAARREAMALRADLGDVRGTGINLRWLARLHLLTDGTQAARDHAQRAVALLESVPHDHELAIAYATLAHIDLFDNDLAGAQRWGKTAHDLATRLDDSQALCAALNALAGAGLRLRDDPTARQMLERTLALSLERGADVDAACAYHNLFASQAMHHDFVAATQCAERGIAFCEARGIDLFAVRMRTRRAFVRMQTGEWAAAEADLVCVQQIFSPSARERALCDLAQRLLDVRRGTPGVHAALEQASDECQRHAVGMWFTSLAAVRAEAAWLHGESIDPAPLQAALAEAVALGDRWVAGALAVWLARLGHPNSVATAALAPAYALEITGTLRDAAAEWQRLGCPYERAVVLAGGNEADLREALAAFETLGARPAAERVRRRLRALGASGVQRGPQPRTRKDPLGFTARERQIFDLLMQGLSNAAIAHRLCRSERTVENHVAAVLGKTGATNRVELITRFATARA